MRDDDLAKKLSKVQKEKKCLVVIDDIWSTEAWSTLSAAFPNETTSGSKVLLTTHHKKVALIADREGFVYEPNCLNEENSWELFQRKAFPSRGDIQLKINEDKENRGRERVEAGPTHEQARLSEVLALSYHELPYQLKPCFRYLSQLPEDFDIPTKKLVQQWVAEGFVFSQDEIEGDETMEDVAEGYLHSLINRCMVQVGVRGSTGTIKTCRLHDLTHDLCLSKARQESFNDIIDHWCGNETLGALPSSIGTRSIRKSRRLLILLREDVDDLIPLQYKKNHNLRSLFFFRSKKHRLDIAHIMNSVVFKFRLLKVLDLEGIKGPEVKLPADIGTPTQLRFLSIKKTLIRELPSSLVNLVFLETLNLQTINKFSWESSVQLPDVLWKMVWLRHLYLPKWW
ncbi:hypothetical protein SLEP1_g58247 [Rubroshorea leprosula]|uniref:NB-ARC domain-containing protein n=1 Tax=Rubroshorea leprosula TaxID=152421 RepID=A0AAV5MT93_9ROSI|nr:hypothetical protein SLEP1_g58247 [Rubroshorea leprosula]